MLVKSGEFKFFGKKVLQSSDTLIEVILIDVTEQPIERPKKDKKRYYSGKKKRYTQKAPFIINQKTKGILAIEFGVGSRHDFQLFKDSRSILAPSFGFLQMLVIKV